MENEESERDDQRKGRYALMRLAYFSRRDQDDESEQNIAHDDHDDDADSAYDAVS